MAKSLEGFVQVPEVGYVGLHLIRDSGGTARHFTPVEAEEELRLRGSEMMTKKDYTTALAYAKLYCPELYCNMTQHDDALGEMIRNTTGEYIAVIKGIENEDFQCRVNPEGKYTTSPECFLEYLGVREFRPFL